MTGHTSFRRASRLLGAAATALLLAACGDELPVAEAPPVAAESIALPTINGTPPETANVGDAYRFQVSATDPLGKTLTFQAEGLPAWAALDAVTGTVTGTPTDADLGETAEITIAATNGKDVTALPAFKIKVNSNKPSGSSSVPGAVSPVIGGTPSATATAGTEWSFTPAASDADSLTLTYSIVNKPKWASFSASTGKLSGTPALHQLGDYTSIRIAVSDGAHTAGLPAFAVKVVAPANRAPTITGAPGTTASAGAPYSFVPTAADPEKQALGFSIVNKPSWAAFNTATGRLSGTPTSAHVGTTSGIVISVSDGSTRSSLPAFALTVSASANRAPTISGTPATAVGAGKAYSFKPAAADADGDALTYSISGKPSWATFTAATGELSGTPGAGDQGSFPNIIISVSDGKVTTALPSYGILVSAPTVGSATLSWIPPTQNTDGSTVTGLAGYRIYYGTNAQALTSSIQITNPGLTSYTIGNLTGGTYYFAIAAYTADGVEGARSTIGSKTL